MMTDECWMQEALKLAQIAFDMGEIPVGAVVVKDDVVIGKGYNRREHTKNSIEHAEILAISEACRKLGDWRLTDCTLYVTLEPCPMCAGAVVNSRIRRVVYGAADAAAGCCGSVLNLNAYPFNHAFLLTEGICAVECGELLKRFFLERRSKKNDKNGVD